MTDANPALLEELVIVLDFGGQYTQLIARRVRECHVYCEILPYDTPAPELAAKKPRGIIFSGGPSSVYEDGAPSVDKTIYELGIPILGICYGTQLMAYQLGGKVTPGERKEFGKTNLEVLEHSGIFDGLQDNLICWMSHGDLVESASRGFQVTARTGSTPVAAMEDRGRKIFGVQFIPRWCTPRAGPESCATSCTRSVGCGACGQRRASSTPLYGHPREGGLGPCGVRSQRRHRLLLHCGTRSQGYRGSTHMHIREPRPAATE